MLWKVIIFEMSSENENEFESNSKDQILKSD